MPVATEDPVVSSTPIPSGSPAPFASPDAPTAFVSKRAVLNGQPTASPDPAPTQQTSPSTTPDGVTPNALPNTGFVSSKAQISTPTATPRALPNTDFVSQKANLGPGSTNFTSPNAPLDAQQAVDALPSPADVVQNAPVTPGFDANAKLDMSSGTPAVGKPDPAIDKAIYDTAANVATSGRVDTTMGNQTSQSTPEQTKALADSPKNLYQLAAQNQISPETLDAALMLRGQQWNLADPAQKLLKLFNTGAQLAGTVMGTATSAVTGELNPLLDPLLNVFGRKYTAPMDATPGGFPKTWEQVSPNQLNKPQGPNLIDQRGPLTQGAEEGAGALFDALGRTLPSAATDAVKTSGLLPTGGTTNLTPGGFPKTWEQVGTGPKDDNNPPGPSPSLGINSNITAPAPVSSTKTSEADQANEAALQKDTRTGLSIGSNLLTSVEHAGQAIAQNTGDVADAAAKLFGGPSQSVNKWLGLYHPEDNLFDAYGFTLKGLPYEQMPLDQRNQYNAARVKQIQDDGTEISGNAENVNHIMDYLTKSSGHYTMSPLELKAYGQEVDPTAVQAASLGLQILATHNLPEIPGFGPLVDHLSEGAINGIRAPIRAADLTFKLASAAAKNETALNVIGGLNAINTAWHAIANGNFDLGTMANIMGTMGGSALGSRFIAKSKGIGAFLDHLGVIAAKGDQVMATAADEASAGHPFFGNPAGDIGKWIPPWIRNTGEAILPSGDMALAGPVGRLAGGLIGQTARAGVSSALMTPAFTQEPEDAAKMVGQMMGYGFMGATPGAVLEAFHAPFDHLFTPKYGSLIPGKYGDTDPRRGFGTNADGGVNAPFRPYGTDAEADRVDKATISMFPQDTQNRINNLRQLGNQKWQVHVFDDQSMDNVIQAHSAAQAALADQNISRVQKDLNDALIRGDNASVQSHSNTIKQLQDTKALILSEPSVGGKGFFFSNGIDGTGPMQAYVRHGNVDSALGHEGLGHPVWNIMQAMDAKNGTTYAPDFLNAAKRTTNMDTFANDYVRKMSNGGITDATYNNLPAGISQSDIDSDLAAEHGAGLLNGAPASMFTKNPSFQRNLTMGVGSVLEHVLGIPVTGLLARHEFDGFQGSVGAALQMDQAIRAMSTDPSTVRPWQAKISKIAQATKPIDPDEIAAQSLAKGGRFTIQQARDVIAKSKTQGSPNGGQPPVKYTPAQNARAILVNPNAQGFTVDEANRHVPDNAPNIGEAVMSARKSILAERKAAGIPSPDEQRAAKDATDASGKSVQDKAAADAQIESNKSEVQNNLANPEWVSGMEAKHGLKPGSMVAADTGTIHANRLDESPVTIQKGQPVQEGHLGNIPKSDADKVVDDYDRAKKDIENEFNRIIKNTNEETDPFVSQKASIKEEPKSPSAPKAEPPQAPRSKNKERILSAAVRTENGKTFELPFHFQQEEALKELGERMSPEAVSDPDHFDWGYTTTLGKYIQRLKAWERIKSKTLEPKSNAHLDSGEGKAEEWKPREIVLPSGLSPASEPSTIRVSAPPKASGSKPESVHKEEAKGAQGSFPEAPVSLGPGIEITSKGVIEHQPRKKRIGPPVTNQNLPNAPTPVQSATTPIATAAPGVLAPITATPVETAPTTEQPKGTNEHTVKHQQDLVNEGHSPGRAQKIVHGEALRNPRGHQGVDPSGDKVSTLQPDFASRVKDWIKDMRSRGYDPVITQGGRSRAYQQQLYDAYKSGGPNKAGAPGTSYHEFGRAFDWVNRSPDGKLHDDPAAMEVGRQVAKAHEMTGIDGDNDHIQDARYASYKDIPQGDYGKGVEGQTLSPNIGAFGYSGDRSWDSASMKGIGAGAHVQNPGSMIDGYSAGLTKEGAARRGLTPINGHPSGQEFYGEDGNLYRWDDTAPSFTNGHPVASDYIDVYNSKHEADSGADPEQIKANQALIDAAKPGSAGKRGPLVEGETPKPALTDAEGQETVGTGESKQPQGDIRPPAGSAVPSPLPPPIDVSKPSEPLKNITSKPIEDTQEEPRQASITPQTIEDAEANARQQVTSIPGTQAFDNAVQQRMWEDLGNQHAASLSPGDQRVRYNAQTGFTSGQFFDPNDSYHSWLLRDQPPQVMNVLSQVQDAIAGKKEISVNYGSATQKEGGLATNSQRTAAQKESPAEARAHGESDIQVAGKQLQPSWVGVSPGKDGRSNTVIYSGTSPDKLSSNAAQITHVLGSKSPYPPAPLGDNGVAEMDLRGALSNHQNGWDMSGQSKLKPLLGNESDIPQESPGFEPYNLGPAKRDFWNLALQGASAKMSENSKRAPAAAKAFELSRLNSGYSSQGYTNKLGHSIDMAEGPKPVMVKDPSNPDGPKIPKLDSKGRPVTETWTQSVLHPSYETLRADLTKKVTSEREPKIHPGHEAASKALEDYGAPKSAAAIKAGFMPGFKSSSPEDFIKARDKTTRAGYLSPLAPEDIKDHKLYVNDQGTVGAAVDTHGDVQNVFNNGGPKGAGVDAVAHAIKHGGKTLDAFDNYFPKLYRQFGFQETGRMKFNPDYAPKGWDYAKDDNPDVVFMAHKGYPPGGPEAAIERAKGDKGNWIKNEQTDKYQDDYDAAKQSSRRAVHRGGTEVSGSHGETGGKASYLPAETPLSETGERYRGSTSEGRTIPIGNDQAEAYQASPGGRGIEPSDSERLGAYRQALQEHREASDRIDRAFRQGGKPHAIDVAAEESAKQLPALRELARSRGELLPPMDREPDAHGSEHQVWFSDDGKTATKETYYKDDPAHGDRKRFGAVPTLDAADVRDATPHEYLDRIGIQNDMGRKTRVVGVVDQGNGETRIRTEEPTISDAVGHPSMDDISDYMAKRGFQPKEWTSWYNPETKVLASDAQPRNFLKTDHGIYPVDTMLRHADAVSTPLTDADKLKKNEQQRSHLEKKQAKLDTTKPEEDMAWEIMASKIHDLEREHERLSESIKSVQENAPRVTKAAFMPGDVIEKNGERERIKSPAVKFPTGEVYEGVHHPDAQDNGIKDGHFAADAVTPGYTTEPTDTHPDGRFVGMKEGWKIGKQSSQLHPDVDPNKGFLNSEDLADYPHPEDREPTDTVTQGSHGQDVRETSDYDKGTNGSEMVRYREPKSADFEATKREPEIKVPFDASKATYVPAEKAYFMPSDNSLPVEYAKNKDGSPKLDKKGKPKPVKINFDLSKAPRIANKQPEDRMPEDAPNTMKSFDYLSENQQKQLSYQDKVSATGTLAKRASVQLKKWMNDPEIAKGKDWYESMRVKLAKALGNDHEMFSHLLGVTSPRENPHENFLYALEAFERLQKGDFNKHIDLYQKAHDMMKSGDLVQHVNELTGEKGGMTDAEAMARYIHHHDILPERENGKLYGTHGNGILRAISKRWVDEPGGPKTKNYAGNLLGTTNAATIDSWAARFVRQLGYDGEKQWRIQPKSETGVSDYDFAFAQRVFDKAAKSVGMSPDSAQAICWFGAKSQWEKNGWMKGMGGEASSLDTPFDIAHPEGPEGPRLTAVRTREILAQQRATVAKVEKEEKAAAKKAAKLGPPIPSMAR